MDNKFGIIVMIKIDVIKIAKLIFVTKVYLSQNKSKVVHKEPKLEVQSSMKQDKCVTVNSFNSAFVIISSRDSFSIRK